MVEVKTNRSTDTQSNLLLFFLFVNINISPISLRDCLMPISPKADLDRTVQSQCAVQRVNCAAQRVRCAFIAYRAKQRVN